MAAERLGVRGLLLTVTRADGVTRPGDVTLGLDYAGFANAFGGDWSSRLRLARLPACAVTMPTAPACRTATAVPSRNDAKARRVIAQVQVAAAGNPPGTSASSASSATEVYALAAGPSGSAGSYAATSLSPSSIWQVSQQTGDFTWSYPLRVPPGLNGPTPQLALAYSAGSVDGRTASTNNQPSWVGEGFGLEPGFVERKYVSCADDTTGGNNPGATGDLCWKSDNASVVLGGHTSELVKDTATGKWKLLNDDSSKIDQLTAGSNGDNNGEYWRLTTTDGTKYYFGIGKRTASDTTNTNSTWTVPVFGNQAGEPCNAATYAASWCDQGWRWNLDYVVDPHDNSMTYYYTPEANNYGRNLNSAVSDYTRGGYLTRIEYGERRGSEYATTAPAQVVFSVAERCLPNGTITCDPSQLSAATAGSWPDVPFDQICASSTSCPGEQSPSFFSRKRLTGVTTQVWSGTAYSNVDAYTLTQSFPDPGDGTSAGLWLASVTHAGQVGGTIALPAVRFTGVQMDNRVDGIDNAPPLIKWRISSIATETGSVLSVNYTPRDCTLSSYPSALESNTRRCFPAYWALEGQSTPTLNYFHKYLVDSVVESDLTGGGLDKVTDYSYLGSPAWHYNDDQLTPAKYRSWGQWRGYGTVQVATGWAPDQPTLTQYLYLRGMDGDTLPGGARRSVAVTDSEGGVLTDSERLNGYLREQILYNGRGGAQVSGTINDPWISAATATDGTKTQALHFT